MKDNQLVLNLLVFAEKVEKGALQAELIQEAAHLGFANVEIRREYFKDLEKEMPVIKKIAEELKITLFYSVPEEVFIEGKLNPQLSVYLEEAKAMGVKHIKWNIGDFQELPVAELKALTKQGIAINIENDQTQTSGTIQAIAKFMEAVTKNQLNIGYVYDLGNWRFVGEDEVEAAEKLKDYVRYIHIKDVTYIDEKPTATDLGTGVIDWQKVLTILPKDVPVAIEYPTTENNQILAAKQLLGGA